jgi:hypothetical protein
VASSDARPAGGATGAAPNGRHPPTSPPPPPSPRRSSFNAALSDAALSAASDTYQQEYGGHRRRALRAHLNALPADDPERVRFKAFELDNRAWLHYRATGSLPASLASAGLEALPSAKSYRKQQQQQQQQQQHAPAPPDPPAPQRDYARYLTPTERAERESLRADVETYRRLGLHHRANRARFLAGHLRVDVDDGGGSGGGATSELTNRPEAQQQQHQRQQRKKSPAQVLQRLIDAKNAFTRLTRTAQRRARTGEIPRADEGRSAVPPASRLPLTAAAPRNNGGGTNGSKGGKGGKGGSSRPKSRNLSSAMAIAARRRRASSNGNGNGSSSRRRRPTMVDEFPPDVRARLDALRDGYTEYQRRGFTRPETREAFLRGEDDYHAGDDGSSNGRGKYGNGNGDGKGNGNGNGNSNGNGNGNGNGVNGHNRVAGGDDGVGSGSNGDIDARERAALVRRLRSDYNAYMATYRTAAEHLKKQRRQPHEGRAHDGNGWHEGSPSSAGTNSEGDGASDDIPATWRNDDAVSAAAAKRAGNQAGEAARGQGAGEKETLALSCPYQYIASSVLGGANSRLNHCSFPGISLQNENGSRRKMQVSSDLPRVVVGIAPLASGLADAMSAGAAATAQRIKSVGGDIMWQAARSHKSVSPLVELVAPKRTSVRPSAQTLPSAPRFGLFGPR